MCVCVCVCLLSELRDGVTLCASVRGCRWSSTGRVACEQRSPCVSVVCVVSELSDGARLFFFFFWGVQVVLDGSHSSGGKESMLKSLNAHAFVILASFCTLVASAFCCRNIAVIEP